MLTFYYLIKIFSAMSNENVFYSFSNGILLCPTGSLSHKKTKMEDDDNEYDQANSETNWTLKAMSFTFGTMQTYPEEYVQNPIIEMMFSFNLFRMKKHPNIENGKQVNLKFYVTISTLYSRQWYLW